MKQDWTDILRDKLANHTETPPAGLWDAIDAATKPQPKKHSLWRWIPAAAACSALVIGIALIPQQSENMMAEHQEKIQNAIRLNAAPENAGIQEKLLAIDNLPKPEATIARHVAKAEKTVGNKAGENKAGEKASLDSNAEEAATERLTNNKTNARQDPEPSNAQTPEKISTAKKEETKSSIVKKAPANSHNANRYIAQNNYPKRKKTAQTPSAFTLSLYGSSNFEMPELLNGRDDLVDEMLSSPGDYNGFPNHNFSDPNNPDENGNLSSNPDPDNPDNPSDNDKGKNKAPAQHNETRAPRNGERILNNVKHHQPLHLGVTVSYPVSNRLSINAGVVFSRLKSEAYFYDRTKIIAEKHEQINLGVPLGATLQIVEFSPVSLYLTGGGMAEKCLSGEEKCLQFSSFVGGGLQISLTDGLALYAEPLYSYYFDNHSPAINVYKDRKSTIDFRLGLRLNLGR